MALTFVSSTCVVNGNMGMQTYVSDSTGSKCLCCPYGYHIDLDFVRYCEAVAAGSASDRLSTERRRKRERRRQCQSMEVLLGLVSPALTGIEAELTKIPQECTTVNGVLTLSKSNHLSPLRQRTDSRPSPVLDLSDVVGDFEATLKRSSRSSKASERRFLVEIDGMNGAASVQNAAQLADSDNASVGSGNSNLSTGALQNIREQMAMSLERMKELEEQVKAIPMLQVQVSVLKEEKRNLLRRVDELSKTNSRNDILHRHRSQSFSEQRATALRNLKNTGTIYTRDMGTMCGVMTRDIGVSHQQVRTRDVGMITSTPIKPSLQKSQLRIEEIMPEIQDESTVLKDEMPSSFTNFCDWQHRSWKSNLARSQLMLEEILPEVRKRYLMRPPLHVESPFNENDSINRKTVKKMRDFGINTENRSRVLQCSHFLIEDIPPEAKKEMRIRSCGTTTSLSMKDILTSEDTTLLVEDALKSYKSNLVKNTSSKSVQCIPETLKLEKRDYAVQVAELFRMRSHVSVTAKPSTMEIGIEVKLDPSTKSVCVGPDPVVAQSPVSLNSMNSRSCSFNYGDTRIRTRANKSVAVTVDDLVKTITRGTDTFGHMPKCRDFGTSMTKKKFVDVSVGDSVRPHISISCAANYCDNCKETIKNLAKQIANNAENSLNHQNSNMVSRIPRPSHISLNTSGDYRKQFKRQDTYTKILAAGVIRYNADNKEQYDSSNRIQQLQIEKNKHEKITSKEMCSVGKEVDNEEKSELLESTLFQPIQDKPRKKVEPTKEMQAAMKVLNDSIKKSPSRNISHQLKNATNIIQQEWFKISSTSSANPLDVEDYLDRFEECSSTLLEYIVNMIDTSGNTAMHYAVSHGNFDVVSILLDSKVCDINKANVAGYTAVMLAALAEVRNSTHASVANRLFQLADVNIRAKLHGQTALMLAVSHGRKDMTQLLVDAGAAVNIQDEDGSTALMCAAEHGHTDIVRLLLAHPDCDSSIVDVDGSSALKIALEAGNRDIGVLLYAHEHVNRGTSPYSTLRWSRRGSKPTTPTGPSPSAPVSPAPTRRLHSSSVSLNTSKYSAK